MKTTLNLNSPFVLSALVALAAVFGLLPPDALLLSAALTTTGEGGEGGASPSAGASDGSAPGNGAPAAGGGSPAAGAATATDTTTKQPALSRTARAVDRAAARLAGNAGTPTPTSTAGQQAPGGNAATGASTEPQGAAGTASADTKPADGEGGKAAAPASTELTAPQDWPKDRQEAFSKLDPASRALTLAFHKEMHSAFTHGMTQLAEQSKTHQDAITIGQQFQTDPKATLNKLAQRAGIEIFFERPGPEDVPSEEVLNSPSKYAQWVTEKAARDVRAAIARENAEAKASADKEAETAAVAKATTELQQELAKAEQDYPDFGQHKPEVIALLRRTQGGLSTEEAYRLTTYDAMVKRVNEGEAAKRELVTLKAEIARKAKDATRLPAGGATTGGVTGEDKFLSTGARAVNRAAAKLAARTATG